MRTTETVTLLSLLSHLLDQASQAESLRATKLLHARLLRTGLVTHPNLRAKLVVSYAASPQTHPSVVNLLSPHSRDPSPWNAVVAALSRRGLPFLAVRAFALMHRLALPLDSYSLCSVLTAATAFAQPVLLGKQIHVCAFKSGWMRSIFIGGALIDFYAKSSAVEDARKLFDEIPVKNAICANALLAGYVESKRWVEGVSLLHRLRGMGIEPDGFTLTSVLRICTKATDVALGLQAHACLFRRIDLLGHDVFLQSSLVEMYGRCGLVQKARLVFELACRVVGKNGRDVVLWTSMLNAYGRNGQFEDVIEAYEEMLAERTQPDEVAFLAVLSACSHSGNVIRGLSYFESMSKDYGVNPSPEHYSCVVDMLCRAGDLEKAWKFANQMVLKGGGGINLHVSMWGSLLSACKDHGDVGIGKVAAEKALDLDPGNAGIYVELSNLYARIGMWDEIGELRELMKERGLKKDLGSSWLELKK